MHTTKLSDSFIKDSQDKGKEYLLALDVDRLIAPCYEAVPAEPKKERYGGWESTGISGHSLGHWLSAAVQMYAITDDEQLKEKIDYAVEELAYLQSLDPYGYVSGFPRACFDQTFTGEFEVERFSLAGQWVPWYSLHKIFAGLIDAYSIIGHDQALEVVVKLADWAVSCAEHITDEQFQKMLICEHGGMNEAMADLYTITNNPAYLNLAIRFCHEEVLEPLAKGIDELEGRHANTQIPKVVGAAKLFNITREEKYKKMAVFFWEQVTKTRSYLIGGNSINEHFGPPNEEKLGVQSAETCNTYNILKLTELLFEWTKDSAYMDFYERAFYNHILASQDPDSGMKTYFVSTQPGHFKVYCTPEHSFWCCTGTGMENPARYPRSIYFLENNALYVSLFVASEIRSEVHGIHLQQVTDFPNQSSSRLIFEKADDVRLALKIRAPYWITGEFRVTINGEGEDVFFDNGYAVVERSWNAGDTIDVELPMGLHLYHPTDGSKKRGIMYGPVVLAGALGRENFPESDILTDHLKLNNHPLIQVPALVTDDERLEDWITRVEGTDLLFETAAIGQPGNQKLTLKPFYNVHHERYTIYWNLMDSKAFETFVDVEQEAVKRSQANTIDEVQPNEQQPEVEHNLQKEQSTAGYSKIVQRGYREARDSGYFSYDMAVRPDQKMKLEVSYFGGDHEEEIDGQVFERTFKILVDDREVAEVTLSNSGAPASTFDVVYDIPQELTSEKEKVTVAFASKPGTIAGGIYRLRTIK